MSLPLRQKSILDWFDAHQRVLPWRKQSPNPYHVWLSEIMLQQTTVATVIGYFTKFITQWPTLEDLAAAKMDDVLHAWQGLGYYTRARNLLKTAQAIASKDFDGKFPETEDALRKLPGIGPYTAAAIAAIAFQRKAAVVDGNIIRVMSRILGDTTPLPQLKENIHSAMEEWTPTDRPGDFAQALMDLSALICRPRNPSCTTCPCAEFCEGYQNGNPEIYPRKEKPLAKPHYYAYVMFLENSCGHVWIRQRPLTGLLGGLWELPMTSWGQEDLPGKFPGTPLSIPHSLAGSEPGEISLPPIHWTSRSPPVQHTFSHFRISLVPVRGKFLEEIILEEGTFFPQHRLSEKAFSTMMWKVIQQIKRLQDA